MPIPPANLAALAGKKKPNQFDDEDEIDALDVAEESDEDIDELDDEEDDADEEDEEDVDVDAIGQQVEDGEWPDKGLMERAKSVDEEHNPPSWALDEDIWEKAKDAVEDNWDSYDEPYAVVAAVYQKMGGKIEAAE